MKRFSIVTVICLLIVSMGARSGKVERREEGNLVIEGIPFIPQDMVDRMVQYRNTRSASLQGWDALGKGLFISTRFGETRQIHYVAAPGGARRQITFFHEQVSRAKPCPDPAKRGFLFGKDVGGGELYQIFYFDLNTGEYRMLTDGSSRNGEYGWSHRGDRFAFYSTRRNGRDWDIYIGEIDHPEETRAVLTEGGVWRPGSWSKDDERLIVGRTVSVNESYRYILDIETGELDQINQTDEKVAFGCDAVWSGDGNGVFYTLDEGSEFKHLRYWDIRRRESKLLTGEIPWDVERLAISDHGEMLAFTVNEGGVTKLYIMDTGSFTYETVPGLPAGEIYGLSFDPGSERLGFTLSTPRTTGDVYVLSLADGAVERWTESEIGGLDTGSFVMPELIRYPTFDKVKGKRRNIPAFYFKPRKGEAPFPVIVYIHGGPEDQYTPYFSTLMQYLINERGIAMIAPNVRGSSGYGKSYLKLDNGCKREDSVKDIGKLLDWIEEQDELDASRIAILGSSYGGYMVLASMVHFNDRLKAAVDIVGISNFVTFLENTKEYRRDTRRVEYGDERDPKMREFLTKISPLTNAHKITNPIFIIQGLNDPRVPVGEAEQMLKAVRKNGGEAWYLLAKDEGHGFRKKQNADYMVHAIVLFLEEHLLGREP